jgi:hypothetical protein
VVGVAGLDFELARWRVEAAAVLAVEGEFHRLLKRRRRRGRVGRLPPS